MQFQRNVDKYAKERGMKRCQKPDRVTIPNWGTEITVGSHKGEKLTSYAQCWDMICEGVKGTAFLNGIK